MLPTVRAVIDRRILASYRVDPDALGAGRLNTLLRRQLFAGDYLRVR